jgi:hypothetical protein
MSHSRHSADDRQNWAPAPEPHQPAAAQYPPAQVYPQQPAQYGDSRQVPAYPQATQTPTARRGVSLSAAASFWYILGCIAFGAAYFAKVPAKKALAEAGMAQMTAPEKFWYVLQCIAFGAGYFAKLPVKKALSEASLY